MRLNDLAPAIGSKKKRKRVGRGQGSGHGTTSCKGHKGQRARSGGGPKPGFEGGQMPLQRRIPKRGFFNRFKTPLEVVNVGSLNVFEPQSKVGIQELKAAGLIKKGPVKLLGNGDLDRALYIKVNSFSAKAMEKVVSAGGRVEVI